jgi:archaellum component FlaC
LDAVAESTTQLAEHLRTHPHEFRKVSESMEGVGKKFNDLVNSTSEFARINEKLQKTVADVSQASNWIGGNYSGEGYGGTSNGGRTQTFPVG